MYQLVTVNNMSGACIRNIADGLAIPCDPANSDYQHYLKWLDGYEVVNGEWVKTSEGNTPLPADQE